MPAAKREIKLNTDTNFLKLIAIVSMTIDHAGKIFFPHDPIFRIIGRIAFPIFAYCLTVGSVYTRNMPRYLLRIGLLALISQPIYVIALYHTTHAMNAIQFAENPVYNAFKWYWLSWSYPNILASLFAALLLIWTVREEKFIFSAIVFLLIWQTRRYLNYGLEGIILMMLFYAFCDRPLASLVWVGGFMIWWGLGSSGYSIGNVRFGIQMFALLALPMIYLRMNTNVKINKSLFYFFYPLHLLIIYLIDLVV